MKKQFKVMMEITMLIDEDIKIEGDFKDGLEKGDIEVSGFDASIVDEDGNSLLDDDERNDMFAKIVSSLTWEG